MSSFPAAAGAELPNIVLSSRAIAGPSAPGALDPHVRYLEPRRAVPPAAAFSGSSLSDFHLGGGVAAGCMAHVSCGWTYMRGMDGWRPRIKRAGLNLCGCSQGGPYHIHAGVEGVPLVKRNAPMEDGRRSMSVAARRLSLATF